MNEIKQRWYKFRKDYVPEGLDGSLLRTIEMSYFVGQWELLGLQQKQGENDPPYVREKRNRQYKAVVNELRRIGLLD